MLLRGDGIWLFDTRDALVSGCTLSSVRDGIYLSYGSGSVVTGTRIEGSRYAIHDMYSADVTVRDSQMVGNLSGIIMMYGGPVLVEGNSIVESGSPSTGFGVMVKDAAGVELVGNLIADNRVGIRVDDAGRTGADPTTVTGNAIIINQVGVLLAPSADPVFTGNSFVENTAQVALGGSGSTQAVWTVDGSGNHWSDYQGFDLAGDGIGDLPHTSGGTVGGLVGEDPVLTAVASGPAFRLLSAVEERWSPSQPLVIDEAPVMERPESPVGLPRPGTRIPAWMPGLLMLAAGSIVLGRGRLGPGR
jgi:nitrous oxidase accessory protein